MKRLFSIIAMLWALALPVCAQEGQGYGFLNIANLIPGQEPCKITIGGEELVPKGLKGGAYTGWFMAKGGSKTISITCGELDKASGSIQLVEGVANLVAIYLEPDKRKEPDGTPFPPKVRIRSFPAYDTRGFGLQFVSLCPGENRFQLGPMKIEPKPFEPVKMPKWNGSGFEVLLNGNSIGKVNGNSESGAFYLLVGTDHKGAFASVLVSSNNQEVPGYLREKKTEAESSAAASQTPATEP
jgi:hypothetical protein